LTSAGKWGPVRAVLAVWIGGDVAVSFAPFYILAELSLHGEASIKVFGIGFELMLDAPARPRSAGERRRPYSSAAKVTIKVGPAMAAPGRQEEHSRLAGATRAACRAHHPAH